MKIKKLSLQLPCQYSDDELAEKRDRLSDVIIAIGETEFRKTTAAKAFKEELDGLYSESGKLAHQIKDREETRMVDCVCEMNKPQVGEKTTVRLDTGEMLKVEVMTDEERQEEIVFDVEENRKIEDLLKDAHAQPSQEEPPQEQPGN
jgi:hypothetical protein